MKFAPNRSSSFSRWAACVVSAAPIIISGCSAKLSAPDAPPPGIQANLKEPLEIRTPVGLERGRREIHPRWLGTRDWAERQTAVDALRRIGPAALPTLVEFLHGPDRNMRELSARAIALMGPPGKAAVPDLIAALSDLDPDVRKNVMRAIGQMGPDAQSAIPALVQEIHKHVENGSESDSRAPGPARPRPDGGSSVPRPDHAPAP